MNIDTLIQDFKLDNETEKDFLKSVPPIMFEIEEETPTTEDIAWGKKVLATFELNGEELKERRIASVESSPCRVYGCVNGTVKRRKNGYVVRVPCPACNPK